MNGDVSIIIEPVQPPQQVNINVNEVAAAMFFQNNSHRFHTYVASGNNTPFATGVVANLVNTSLPILFSETDIPWIAVNVIGTSPAIKHIYLFKNGKGLWGGPVGSGGTQVDRSMFQYLLTQNATPDDVQSGGNTSVIPLGVLPDGDYIAAANMEARNLTNPNLFYFLKFTTSGTDYILRFVGTTYGIYGGASLLQFAEADFEEIPVVDTPEPSVPTLDQVAAQGNSTGQEIISTNGAEAAALEPAGGVYFKNNGKKLSVRPTAITADKQYNIDGNKANGDTFAMVTDVTAMGAQLIDGAGPDYNTLYKVQLKLTTIMGIIGQAGTDPDTLVNTVQELLQVFENYPEGANMALALAGKINVADIVNNLTQVVSGKVLDAAQGKILNDAITALTTTVSGKLTGTQATDAETQMESTITEDNKYVSRAKLRNWWVWIKTQAQTIAGIWTFSASPLVPDVTYGDNTTKAANTKFVQAAISALNLNIKYSKSFGDIGVHHSGNTNNTVIYTIDLPSWAMGDVNLNITALIAASGTAGIKTFRWYLVPTSSYNSSNPLSGAVQIATTPIDTTTASYITGELSRTGQISGNTLTIYPATSPVLKPTGSTLPFSAIPVTNSVAYKLMGAVQLGNSADTAWIQSVYITSISST